MKNTLFMETWQEVLNAFPDTARIVLETFSATGLADTNHILLHTGLPNHRIRRTLERILSGGLLTQLDRALPRPDQRGKPVQVFLLSEDGASVLKKLGYPEAHPCGLQEDTSLLHRLAMTDVHLAAVKAGRTIITDRELPFGENQNIRPDHQVKLEDGRSLLLEVEQFAAIDVLRRIVESLQHKQNFFASEASEKFLPEVRMLLQLPRGAKWNKTLRVWEKALGVVKEKSGKGLNFRLFAIPRREFLEMPDWEAQRNLLWTEITPPEKNATIQLASNSTPETLLYRSPREDRLVLSALWQDFIENVSSQELFPQPDPEFFQIMRLIYSASHDPELSDLAQSAMPNASIYLLNKYLSLRHLHPRLIKALHNGKGDLRWNPTMIMHRMQVVIDTILAAHGWRSDGLLFAIANLSEWGKEESRTFGVTVRIRNATILMSDEDLVVPGANEVYQTERALEWVLKALFQYSLDLGLGRIEFW